jgi:aspartyl-tRNA(Asn)/glutamyl-tRNA(Gln) amidotransferase subunit C
MNEPDFISPETFNHLVELAALALDAEEAEYLRGELNNQLKAVTELEAIPLDFDTPVTSHGVAYTAASSPAPRADTWQPYENPAGILEQAPQSEDGYFIVPDIPSTELD